MQKLFYPAVFHPEEVGYSVSFPDLSGCYTEADTLEESEEGAFDAIGLFLEDIPPSKYPVPSNPQQITVKKGDFIVIIPFDQLEYAKKWNTKAVRKSLTIPAWLNELAEAKHINFSKILQNALKSELNIEK